MGSEREVRTSGFSPRNFNCQPPYVTHALNIYTLAELFYVICAGFVRVLQGRVCESVIRASFVGVLQCRICFQEGIQCHAFDAADVLQQPGAHVRCVRQHLMRASFAALHATSDRAVGGNAVHHCALDAVAAVQVFFNNQEHMINVRCRPHLQPFMQRVAELFEVVVFTASQKIYAEVSRAFSFIRCLDATKKPGACNSTRMRKAIRNFGIGHHTGCAFSPEQTGDTGFNPECWGQSRGYLGCRNQPPHRVHWGYWGHWGQPCIPGTLETLGPPLGSALHTRDTGVSPAHWG
eukprot:scaffold38423_cov17-Tisochrysis_lutea.AAC.2